MLPRCDEQRYSLRCLQQAAVTPTVRQKAPMFSKRAQLDPNDPHADWLPGRDDYAFPLLKTHSVLGTSLVGPWPGTSRLYVGMGCFWGAEKVFWETPGVVSTAVGYMGGHTAFPTYAEVCTGRTGHAEVVSITYNPGEVTTAQLIAHFFEHHDPTQHNRQGNDIGTAYRSTLFVDTSELPLAQDMAKTFSDVLTTARRPAVVTTIHDAGQHTFYYAEASHQQYLHINPHGYNCHARTGMSCPLPPS